MNFYVVREGEAEKRQIGKVADGFRFNFAGDVAIRSYSCWLGILRSALEAGSLIADECGRRYSLDEFAEIVEKSCEGRNPALEYPDGSRTWVDNTGHPFTGYEFF